MTTLFESIYTIWHSSERLRFKFSLLAILTWCSAIALTFVSGFYRIPHGDYIITGLLAASALLAIVSIPRRQAATNAQDYLEQPNTGTANNN